MLAASRMIRLTRSAVLFLVNESLKNQSEPFML
jgi:hypothetical protein